jgi:hypothetical protein
MHTRKTKTGSKLLVAGLAALLAAGCLDLDVVNPNAPDRDRALQTASDIEALVAGSFSSWWQCQGSAAGPGPILATISYQHSATAANFGMVEFSGWPKVPAHTLPSDSFSGELVEFCWSSMYQAASAVVDGLKSLDAGVVELPQERLARANAFGYFTLGLAHAHAAMLFDQAYIYDPTMEFEDVELRPYTEVMDAALGYFDRAIQEATGQDFTLPAAWTSIERSADDLVRMAHSFRARYRAAVARTPDERAAVDWQAVLADIGNGIEESFDISVTSGSGFASNARLNMARFGPWGQLSMQVLGMADTSGNYQTWISAPPQERRPVMGGQNMLIHTPDLRFAQGADRDEQFANKGSYFEISEASGNEGAQWVRPDRGTFRWSFYRPRVLDMWHLSAANRTVWPEIKLEEMDLLRAEALFRTGDPDGAATIVNQTRTAAGLAPTDGSGVNTDCVPRLPNGDCGDLFEMLKWEVRLETLYAGLNMAPWYFHGRGWGDLAQGTFLHLPVPAQELQLLGLPAYTFGPGHAAAAPVGTYGY